MKKYLFLFTITPVQSFLAQARKTQDLFAGSQILSDLIRAGMGAFDGKVIFPAQTAGATYPNRFLGKTTTASVKDGEKVENAVKSKLTAISQSVLAKNFKSDFRDYEKQIENYFNFFWLFEEIIEDDYRSAYENIERKLGAIKNLRSFEQSPEIGRKCSLTGEHNALIYKPNSSNTLPAFVNDTSADDRFAKKVKKANSDYINFLTEVRELDVNEVDYGEGLSSMAYLKRFYDKNRPEKGFPSTARIAAFNVLREIEDEEVFKNYINLFEKVKKFDEQLLYGENIRLGYFEKQGLSGLLSENHAFYPYINSNFFTRKSKKNLLGKIQEEFEANIQEFTSEHKKIVKLIKTKDIHLSSYYALLLFDADNMGAWLNGQEYLPESELSNLESYHNYVSGLLSKYAQTAQKYLNQDYRGKTVYAGGDDFMGFINLFHLFDSLKYLRETFKKEVSEPLKEKFNISVAKNITFSAGLVIAHYKHPLSDVLIKGREAEQEAKNTLEKDALSFTVLKNSGEMLKSVLKWDQGEVMLDMKSIIDGLESDFSTKFIYALHTELDIYHNYNFSDKDSTKAENIVRVEAERLVSRACQLSNSNGKEEAVNKMHKALMKLFKNCLLQTGEIYNFLGLLQILDFLKRKAKI